MRMINMTTVLLGVALLAASMGEVRAQNYPWCAMVEMGGSVAYNCGFATRRQCEATTIGQGGFCTRNPDYQGDAAEPGSEQSPPRGKR